MLMGMVWGSNLRQPLNMLIGYALPCRRPLEVHVCVKLSAPTDAGVQSFFVACLFVFYHGNKPSKMYLIKGSLEVKLPTRGTYGKAEVGRFREEQRRSKKIREEKGSEERRCRCHTPHKQHGNEGRNGPPGNGL